jgi:hypothetical protein
MKSHLYAITAITLAMTAMTTLWAAGATGAAVLGLLVAPLYPADWLAACGVLGSSCIGCGAICRRS